MLRELTEKNVKVQLESHASEWRMVARWGRFEGVASTPGTLNYDALLQAALDDLNEQVRAMAARMVA